MYKWFESHVYKVKVGLHSLFGLFSFLISLFNIVFFKKKFLCSFFQKKFYRVFLISWHESWVLQVNLSWLVFLLSKLYIYRAISSWLNLFFLVPFCPILYLERYFYKLYGFFLKRKNCSFTIIVYFFII